MANAVEEMKRKYMAAFDAKAEEYVAAWAKELEEHFEDESNEENGNDKPH